MLVQVAVENFMSIEEEVVFKMIATRLKGHENHKIDTVFNQPDQLLKIGAIYGANASGKTNLIKAIQFSQDLIVDGTRSGQRIGAIPFKLSAEYRDKPTTIEFIMYLDEQIYTYGFAVTQEKVEEEWLYAQRRGSKERKLFERVSSDEHALVETGKSLEAEDYSAKMLQMVARSTRINQLYMFELKEKNHPGINKITNWFEHSLTIIPAVSEYRFLTLRAAKDHSFTKLVSRILKQVGTGIERVESRSRKVNIERDLYHYTKEFREKLSSQLNEIDNDQGLFISSELMQRVFEKKDGDILEFRLKTIHKDKEGNEIAFDMEEESEGTFRLMHLIPLLADIQAEEKVVFVDELDRRLHPMLSRTLVDLFNKINPGNNKSQLIFTTHDTNLLDQDLLRRDEVWFMEKNKYGASQLTSLAEYNIRNDKKLDKDYLLGRFGGIPNIRYDVLEPAYD